jgi:glycerophosphoryl diester phosphodiesterase
MKVELIGHRGAPRRALENTLESFLEAVRGAADAVELDVHVTRDGTPVVHHDPTLGRAQAAFLGRAIAELSAAEVGELRLDGKDRTYPLPTLANVLETIGLGESVRIYVEIKGGSESAVAAVLTPFLDRGGDCAVHSFDHAAIERMRQLAPEIPRGILFDGYPPDLAAAIHRTAPRDVWPRWQSVDPALVEAVHAAGARIIPWTVNSTRAAATLIGMGVDGICTDDLPAVRAAQAEGRGAS